MFLQYLATMKVKFQRKKNKFSDSLTYKVWFKKILAGLQEFSFVEMAIYSFM